MNALASAGDTSILCKPESWPADSRQGTNSPRQHLPVLDCLKGIIRQAPSPPPIPPSITNSASPATIQEPQNFALPIYTNELGSLPIYGQFSFTDLPIPNASDGRSAFAASMNELPGNGPAFGSELAGPHGDHLGHPNQNFIPAADPAFGSEGYQFHPATTNQWGFGSNVGTLPAMDDDTMTMWSTAPTTAE